MGGRVTYALGYTGLGVGRQPLGRRRRPRPHPAPGRGPAPAAARPEPADPVPARAAPLGRGQPRPARARPGRPQRGPPLAAAADARRAGDRLRLVGAWRVNSGVARDGAGVRWRAALRRSRTVQDALAPVLGAAFAPASGSHRRRRHSPLGGARSGSDRAGQPVRELAAERRERQRAVAEDGVVERPQVEAPIRRGRPSSARSRSISRWPIL